MRSRPVPTDDTGEPSVERVDKSRERHARGRSSGGSGLCGRLSGVDDEHPTGYGGTGLAPEVVHTVHRCSAPLSRTLTPRLRRIPVRMPEILSVKRGEGGERRRGQEAATVITLIFAGQQSRCRMTVIRRRAASD
jgi:hypothetical protein